MTDTEYRSLPRLANSDLTELQFRQMGYQIRPIYPTTAQFGTTFHQLILEPDRPIDWTIHTPKQRADLLQMQASYQKFRDRFLHTGPFHFDQTERILLFDLPVDTLAVACKAKLDAVGQFDDQSWVVDLKTTSASSAKEFLASVDKYDYDRQAAFYVDALGLVSGQQLRNNVLFIGIQKQKPFTIYSVNMQQQPKLMQVGRRKYQSLLKKAVIELANPQGWRPSNWADTNVIT